MRRTDRPAENSLAAQCAANVSRGAAFIRQPAITERARLLADESEVAVIAVRDEMLAGIAPAELPAAIAVFRR